MTLNLMKNKIRFLFATLKVNFGPSQYMLQEKVPNIIVGVHSDISEGPKFRLVSKSA